ncbi:MAG: ATP-binding protein, partial [Gaiellaceae bacterium]
MRRDLPSGTVTFLFTDVEGSTRLLRELGAAGYAEALAQHRPLIREAFRAHGGVEVDTQGDAFFIAFPTAPGALEAAEEILDGLAAGPIRVRMGIHTGTPYRGEEGYVGIDVNRAARIAACGHGGQVLISSSTAGLVDSERLRALGEHRLKDLSAPERISQLGEADFPPLKSLHRTNLPVPATPFLGRPRELAEIGELLGREDVRLVTLTGPGGTGKTRVALQAAADASDRFPDGVFWVPLASLREPELLLETAARALGAEDGPADHVAGKRLLLVLDNFEQIVGAAADLSALLAGCPNLHLLVTSRELLLLPGEHAYPVPPLEPQEGVELFEARARAADPAFVATTAVRELCERLDNLPLALELAAARVRVLSPERLLERLAQRLDLLRSGRGVDPRQQTLRATIEWSYELLTVEERRLFARLAVCRGGCTLETAEELCAADLDLLQSLVDKSLVRVRDAGRFWMLETIREYAAERLEESGEAEELRQRHAERFLALVEESEAHVHHDSQEWLNRLQREHDNLRAALDHLGGAGDGTLALRLAGALLWFWTVTGHVDEGRRRLDHVLLVAEGSMLARAKALNAAAGLAATAGDLATSKERAEAGLELYRALGDPAGTADSLWQLGYAAGEEGDWATAQRLVSESIGLFQGVGDERSVLWTTRTLAWTYVGLGDLSRARELHEENLQRARALGDPSVEATLLGALAMIAVGEGRIADATAL